MTTLEDRTKTAHCIVNEDPLIDKEVVQIGSGRTGSTVVWNILKDIYSKAWKTHSLGSEILQKPQKVFFTYRDPRDVILSLLRTQVLDMDELKDENISISSLGKSLSHYHSQANLFKTLEKFHEVVAIKYEDYLSPEQDLKGLVCLVLKGEKIVLNNKKMNSIIKKNSRESNIKISKMHSSFHTGDHESGIHGNHISLDFMCWRDFLNKEEISFLNRVLEKDLIYFEYS
jgi:hypothetical protein